MVYVVSAAVRAGGRFRIMLCEGESLRECFLAGVTYELIIGLTDLPMVIAGF